ncbi:MAG: HD domain-containing protein [Nitrospiraceae bacterium]|nr:HD domain-containing protein [Nitrospiraceae bacterium]
MREIANFLFELGMLKRTPRSGFQFLGSGGESVAEHTFRTACIAYVLGNLEEMAGGRIDKDRLLKMGLFHDLLEARTGDLNYVNKKYVRVDEPKTRRELTGKIPFGPELDALLKEFAENETPEARLAHDADQMEFILALKECKDNGSRYADEWLGFAVKRLATGTAKKLVSVILDTDSSLWWFSDKGDWWVRGGK